MLTGRSNRRVHWNVLILLDMHLTRMAVQFVNADVIYFSTIVDVGRLWNDVCVLFLL